MLNSPKPIVSALLILAVGAYLGFSGKAQKLSKIKTVEEYWAATGLTPAPLEELLQEGSCRSSERYFLACANAVLSVAQKYGLNVETSGRIVPAASMASQVISEKETLAPWKAFLSSQMEATKKIPAVPFPSIWRELKEHHITPSDLSQGVGFGMNGFLSVFKDPHTYLMPADMYREVVAKSNHRSLSIGIILGRDDKHFFVKKVIENSSAYRVGLKKGDVVLSVNGKNADQMSLFELGEQLRGREGSTLRISVMSEGRLKSVSMIRSENTLPSVSKRVLGGIKPLGLITINKFAVGACRQTKKALKDMAVEGIQGLLLDLRDNPGGQMEEAACVASLFVGSRKEIFQVRFLDSSAASEEATFGSERQAYRGPMAVLVNSGSASAAEIVAGALQDYKRAVLVGERTFGKGSFQEGELWGENKNIAIFETKGFYYLPSGRTPQMVGLEPDVKVDFKDRIALREEDQFLFPLRPAMQNLKSVSEVSLSPKLAACISYESDLLPETDPEMKEAHRVLSCEAATGGSVR